jgi:hypothetical protein
MNTPILEIQMPASGRKRGRYSVEFKRQIVAACHEPGVSTAAIALANGLNANMVRRWLVESSQLGDCQLTKVTTPRMPERASAGFIPVEYGPPPPTQAADIRIELQHGSTAVQIHWPVGASSQCAQWLREVLA